MSAEMGSPLNRPLRIGLIGSGFMVGFHVQAFRSVRDCLLAAVYSPTPAHRDAMVERINGLGLGPCSGYDSVEEMVASGAVDAVWIVGPNFTRLEQMEAISTAMSAGRSSLRAVACEKPLGRTVAEARRMVDLVTATGLNHGYLENQVFAPGVRKGREAIWRRGAAISGRPYLARASEEHSGPHRPWFWQGDQQGGGALLDMMCHSVEVARFLLTEPGAARTGVVATTATGHVSTLKWSRPEYAARLRQSMGEGVDYLTRPSEDMAQGVIELHDRDGHPLMIEASTSWAYVGPGLRIGIEVLGPEYSMKLDTLSTGLQLYFSRYIEGAAGQDLVEKQNAEQGLLPVVEDEAVAYGYVAENRHMVEAFSLGKRPEETWADGLAVVELLMGLYRSAELRRTISFGDEDLTDYIPPVGRSGEV
jgi:predicted dehydrogenase